MLISQTYRVVARPYSVLIYIRCQYFLAVSS